MTTTHWPDRASIPFVYAAGATWVGITIGAVSPWVAAAAAVAVIVAAIRHRWIAVVVAVLCAAGASAGALMTNRAMAAAELLPPGSNRIDVRVEANGIPGQWGGSAKVSPIAVSIDGVMAPWDGPMGTLSGRGIDKWTRGSHWRVTVIMRPLEIRSPGQGVFWRATPSDVEPIPSNESPMAEAAASVRRRMLRAIDPSHDAARALVAGFLIGETSDLPAVDNEHMRLAGLSHFVAVSGSNVALFLGALFVVAGPLSWSAVRRAGVGLVGLVLFIALVGPDPSVLRASGMAALVLAGNAIGLRPPIWTVLGSGVTLLLLVSPELAFRLGFQLSVAATAGVVAGSGLFGDVRPKWLATTLGATVGAQLAVAPILLIEFGSVPLWAPFANVVAAPFVALATALGGLGAILGVTPMVEVASWAARIVLAIAAAVAPLPQLSISGCAIGAALGAAMRLPPLRPLAMFVSASAFAIVSVSWTGATDRPALIALDVGQGDAILVLGPSGETILVDGGSSGVNVLSALRRHDVSTIDLLIVTHAHADHFGGLTDVVQRISVGTVWFASSQQQTGSFGAFLAEARSRSVAIEPAVGHHALGAIELEVIGPMRRYESVNDQSLVVVVNVTGTNVLLTGDVERRAQDDIDVPVVDVLKVPHHDATTSDLEWLIATEASVAIISVGANTFGHPAPEVLDALESAHIEVLRTDLLGDVVIPLAGWP